jgi:hypothetical protein
MNLFQERYAKVNRYYINCFNVDPAFAEGFKFPKSKGKGVLPFGYMECAFNKVDEWGEMFIEFEDYVWEHKLEACLIKAGAASVTIQTFAHNDKGKSAVDSLVRIHNQCDKKGWNPVTRGTCPPALQAKVLEKQAAEKTNTQEFDAKTREAERLSILLNQDTNAKVTSVGTNVEQIKDGVCTVIPDYQRKIEELERVVTHKTKECDRIERLKGVDTHTINVLEAEAEEHKKELAEVKEENLRLKETIINLKEQFNLCASVSKMERMMETFSANVEERAAKRARAD